MDEVIKGLADGVKDIGARLDKVPTMEDLEKSRAEAKAAQEQALAVKEQLDVATNDLVSLRKMLEHNLGKSGAMDFNRELDLFVKAVWHQKARRKMPQWLEKAAADYVTDVDATGGYLAPTLLANEVIKLSLAHGQIFPAVNKVTVPPGTAIVFPYESVLASVAWRAGTSSGIQGLAGTEVDPHVAWGADTLRPEWINGYVKISNEAMTSPGISIPQNLAMQLVAQIVRKIEFGILKGYVGTATAHTGRTAPHNGVLYASSVNEQAAAATVTLALVDKFIGECLADHEGSANTDENTLVTTPAVAHQLKTGLTQQGMDWGNVAQGIFPVLRGYRFLTSPFVTRANPTAVRNHILMTPLQKVTVAWSGSFGIDFNDRGEGWTSNETWLMVGTHADFTLGNPAMHHKAVFTALS